MSEGPAAPRKDEDRVSLHPLRFEEALGALLSTSKPDSRTAALDALTFNGSDPDEVLNNDQPMVSVEDAMKARGRG